MNLQTLSLGHTAVAGPGLVHLEGMKKLQSLSLHGTKLNDAGLAAGARGLRGLTSLADLILAGTEVGDDGVACLKAIKSPLGLRLQETRITDRGVAHLRAMTNLYSVESRWTKVSDRCCADLAAMKTLTYVGLEETGVTAAGLHKLAGLPQLKLMRIPPLPARDMEGLLDRMPKRVLIHCGLLQSYHGRAAEKP